MIKTVNVMERGYNKALRFEKGDIVRTLRPKDESIARSERQSANFVRYCTIKINE